MGNYSKYCGLQINFELQAKKLMDNNFMNFIENGTKMKISSVIYRPLEVSAYWQQD